MKLSDLSPSNTRATEAEEPSLELAGLLHVFLRRSWMIALGAVACGLVAGAYVQKVPELYQSRTVIQIESQSAKPIRAEDGNTDNLRDPVVMETVIQNFRNRSLMERVARELDLPNDAAFLGRKDPLPASEREVLGLLGASASVAARAKTLLVDITFSHADPNVARRLAGAIVDQFLLQNAEQQVRQVEAQNNLLMQKAAELKASLERSEAAVQDYKNRMESVSVDSGRNLVESKLQGLNADLTGARSVRIRIESDMNVVRGLVARDADKLLNVPSIASDPRWWQPIAG